MRIELLLADRRIDLVEEGFDLAVRIGTLDDSSLAARKLGEGHVYYVASPDFLAKHGMPRPENLRSFRCVGVRPFETWGASGVSSKIEPVLVVNDLEVACEAAVASVGIAQLPAIVCREAVVEGRLRVLFGPEPAMLRTVYAVYPSRRHLAVKVRLFLDALAAMVKPMLPLDPAARPPTAPHRRRQAPASTRVR